MKNLKNPFTKIIFVFVLSFGALALQPAQAQISFPDDVDDQTPAAPIDGLLSLGLAAGALYGVRKLKEKK